MSHFFRSLALHLQIQADIDMIRRSVLDMLDGVEPASPAAKRLLHMLKRNEKLRRELFGQWYEGTDGELHEASNARGGRRRGSSDGELHEESHA